MRITSRDRQHASAGNVTSCPLRSKLKTSKMTKNQKNKQMENMAKEGVERSKGNSETISPFWRFLKIRRQDIKNEANGRLKTASVRFSITSGSCWCFWDEEGRGGGVWQGQPGQISCEAAAHPSSPQSAAAHWREKIVRHLWDHPPCVKGWRATYGLSGNHWWRLWRSTAPTTQEKTRRRSGLLLSDHRIQTRPGSWGGLTPKLWLKPVLGAGLAALR